jgi:hypothetical protein
MVENRKHFKKDPVPVVKCEVARKWLLKHPAAALQARGLHNKPPQVVMDELRSPLADVQFELKKTGAAGDYANVKPMSTPTGVSPSMPSSGAGGGGGGKKSTPAKVTTSNMLHWDLPEIELPMSMTVATARTDAVHGGPVFKIDDVDILVATDGDYYVVC